jgi:hypothetical protein
MLFKLLAREHRRNERWHWRRRYWDVLKSERWNQLRVEIIAETGGRCEACGYWGQNRLHLHHLHYRALGRETRRDVELLCPFCHEKADASRARDNESRRFNGWCLGLPFLFLKAPPTVLGAANSADVFNGGNESGLGRGGFGAANESARKRGFD